MYINTYTLTGKALHEAWAHNERQRAADIAARQRNSPDMRRLCQIVGYLGVRLGPEWLSVNPRVLEGYLPMSWFTAPLWYVVRHLDDQGITPEHCTLAE